MSTVVRNHNARCKAIAFELPINPDVHRRSSSSYVRASVVYFPLPKPCFIKSFFLAFSVSLLKLNSSDLTMSYGYP